MRWRERFLMNMQVQSSNSMFHIKPFRLLMQTISEMLSEPFVHHVNRH